MSQLFWCGWWKNIKLNLLPPNKKNPINFFPPHTIHKQTHIHQRITGRKAILHVLVTPAINLTINFRTLHNFIIPTR